MSSNPSHKFPLINIQSCDNSSSGLYRARKPFFHSRMLKLVFFLYSKYFTHFMTSNPSHKFPLINIQSCDNSSGLYGA